MGLRGRVTRLQKAVRGTLDSFELADGSRFWFDPDAAARERFMFLASCLTADYRRKPRPEPPEVLRAVASARDREEALSRVMNGYDHLPLDAGALVERGELVPRSLAPGYPPVEDLSE